MKLLLSNLADRAGWEQEGFQIPAFDPEKMRAATKKSPLWLHMGAGNIFRAFPAVLQQKLLESGDCDRGITVAECYDGEIIERAYAPYDCLTALCVLKSDGAVEKKIVASVAEALRCDGNNRQDELRLIEVLASKSLQMVSFTITEKGYAVMDAAGNALPAVARDLFAPPSAAKTTIGKLTAGLYARFCQGHAPIALVSMDNCSHNGDKLRAAVLYMAEGWREGARVEKEFLQYLMDEKYVTFPNTMIDKITPRPDQKVAAMLEECGFEYAAPFVTHKGTYTAAFVNAEETEYLVIEDKFPAGRPPLEKAGVYFTDWETVDRAEKMKVCTCLNPLHTALAVLGCLLGHEKISDEMQDADLNELVHRIAYQEAMPVVVDPGILSPEKFAREVLEKRFPNPFMPDTPQRIATDTSQKLPIRYGVTLKKYAASESLDITKLRYIPFVLAAWLRYLMAVDDRGDAFTPSPDPMLAEMQSALSFLKLGGTATEEQLAPVLERKDVFGVNLVKVGLAPAATAYLNEMLQGPGAVRAALKKVLA